MARMYFSFNSNLPDSINEKATVQVENITFKTDDGYNISVGCNDWSDFGCTNHIYDARFKGLEYQIEDPDGNEILDWEDEPTDEQLNMLSKAKISSILFYWEDDGDFNIPEGMIPTCSNLSVSIEHTTEKEYHEMEFSSKTVNVEVC